MERYVDIGSEGDEMSSVVKVVFDVQMLRYWLEMPGYLLGRERPIYLQNQQTWTEGRSDSARFPKQTGSMDARLPNSCSLTGFMLQVRRSIIGNKLPQLARLLSSLTFLAKTPCFFILCIDGPERPGEGRAHKRGSNFIR